MLSRDCCKDYIIQKSPSQTGVEETIRTTTIIVSVEIRCPDLPQIQSDILSVTLDVTLCGTEMAVLAILKQKPDSSRGEIAEKISKTVRTVQRAMDSLRDKGYIHRIGSKQEPRWEILK